jgi:hypothetical protein
MGEGHGVSRGDAALVNRFVNAATKASFLEDVIASPDQYIHALKKLAVNTPPPPPRVVRVVRRARVVSDVF